MSPETRTPTVCINSPQNPGTENTHSSGINSDKFLFGSQNQSRLIDGFERRHAGGHGEEHSGAGDAQVGVRWRQRRSGEDYVQLDHVNSSGQS